MGPTMSISLPEDFKSEFLIDPSILTCLVISGELKYAMVSGAAREQPRQMLAEANKRGHHVHPFPQPLNADSLSYNTHNMKTR